MIQLIQRIQKYLIQPYPIDLDIKRRILINLGIGIFIVITFLFINIIDTNSIYSILFIIGFGIITFTVITINRIILPRLLPQVFIEEKWTVIKEAFLILLSISSIGFFNLIYVNIGGYIKFNIFTIIEAVGSAVIIGIIPIIIVVLLQQNRLLKKYLYTANELNEAMQTSDFLDENNNISSKQIIISSDSGKEELKLELNDILIIKSVENYVEIFWSESNSVKKMLIRSSLKKVNELLSINPIIFQCHRSFIINIKHIKRIIGNSQGYKLLMHDIDNLIPVSRQYSNTLHQKILNAQL